MTKNKRNWTQVSTRIAYENSFFKTKEKIKKGKIECGLCLASLNLFLIHKNK